MTQATHRYVKRYTTLSSALDTLANKRIALLSPSKWDDMNDVHFMDLYKDFVRAKSVTALCCTLANETYHHWKIFTQGIDGVCLEFNRGALEDKISSIKGLTTGEVEYFWIKDLKALNMNDASRLPFVKRKGFADEREWRIVQTFTDSNVSSNNLDCPPSAPVAQI